MDRDFLFEQHLSNFNSLKTLYENGQISLDAYEMELLKFCHNTDMKKFLKEEVADKPIVLNEDGSLNKTKTKYQSGFGQRVVNQQQPIRFFYLYDDNGNLVAAIPQQ